MRAEAVRSEPTSNEESADKLATSRHLGAIQQRAESRENVDESGIFHTHQLGRILSSVWLTDGTRWIRVAVWVDGVQAQELTLCDSFPDSFLSRDWMASDSPANVPVRIVLAQGAIGVVMRFVPVQE